MANCRHRHAPGTLFQKYGRLLDESSGPLDLEVAEDEQAEKVDRDVRPLEIAAR
jgi:hypothetical protein